MPVSLCPLGTWAAGASFVNLRRVVGTEKHSLDKTVSGHAQNYNIRLASIKIRWFLQWLWFSGVLILIQSKFYSSLLSSQSLRSAQSQFSDCPCTYIFFFLPAFVFPFLCSHMQFLMWVWELCDVFPCHMEQKSSNYVTSVLNLSWKTPLLCFLTSSETVLLLISFITTSVLWWGVVTICLRENRKQNL